MKSLFKYTLFLFAFWQIVFFVYRLFFVLYQQPIGNKITVKTDILRSFLEGYQLDLSVGAIMVLLPMTMAVCLYIFQKNIYKKIASTIVLITLLVYGMTCIGDAGLYREWNAKINMQALEHFQNPSEVFKTLSPKLIFLFLLFVSLLTTPFFVFYKKNFMP
jgi:membrane protein YdbS with pleckstrin-like domain